MPPELFRRRHALSDRRAPRADIPREVDAGGVRTARMARSRSKASLEVTAVFEGVVLDVRHLHPKQATAAAATLGVVGGVLLLVGVGLFLSQTLGEQSAWTEFQQLAAQAAVAGQEPPAAPASPWTGLALGLGCLGVVSLALAFVKGSDGDPSAYTIGEGPNAVLATPPVNLLTPDAFALARIGSTGAAGLRFTADMTGEISAGGRRYTLQEWASKGWAVEEQGVLGTTLPPGARCRLEHGELVFHIAAVEAAVVSVGRFEVDAPFWAITGASFLGLGALLILAQMAAPASGRLDLEDHERGRRFVGYSQRPPIRRMPTRPRSRPEPSPKHVAKASPELPRIRPTTSVPELDVPPDPRRRVGSVTRGGSRGASSPASRDSVPTILGIRSAAAAGALMTRGSGPVERAREAGILASVDTSVFDNEHARAFSPDADDKAMWQAMKDHDPTMDSIAGLGLIGKGRGGGPGSTDGMVSSKPTAESEEDNTERSLVVRVGRATERGPRAPADVRGVVLKHVRALRRCYGAAEDAEPTIPGRMTLELEIDAAGDVVRASVARGRSVDPTITDCMTRVARAWSFPAIDAQRRSSVSLPLRLSPG